MMKRSGMTSITAQVRRSVSSIAFLLAVPAVIGLVVMMLYSTRTQAMIRRMDTIAGMKPALESTIAENLFSVYRSNFSFFWGSPRARSSACVRSRPRRVVLHVYCSI